jgi:hypothetical protein
MLLLIITIGTILAIILKIKIEDLEYRIEGLEQLVADTETEEPEKQFLFD